MLQKFSVELHYRMLFEKAGCVLKKLFYQILLLLIKFIYNFTVSDRLLVCDVTSCVTDHGHLVAKCRVTRGSMLDASSPKESLILLSHETAQRCKINPGSLLKIYPPW